MKRAIIPISVFLLVAAATVFAAGFAKVLGPQSVASNTGYASSLFTPGTDTVKAVLVVSGTVTGKLMIQGSYQGIYQDTVIVANFTAGATNTMHYTGMFSPDSLRGLGLPALDSNSVARNYILDDTENFRYRWIWQEWTNGTHTGTVTLTEIK